MEKKGEIYLSGIRAIYMQGGGEKTDSFQTLKEGGRFVYIQLVCERRVNRSRYK